MVERTPLGHCGHADSASRAEWFRGVQAVKSFRSLPVVLLCRTTHVAHSPSNVILMGRAPQKRETGRRLPLAVPSVHVL